MIWSFSLNSLGGSIVLIAFLFAIDNIDNVLSDPTIFPFMYVFHNATNAGTLAITVIIIFVFIFANVG